MPKTSRYDLPSIDAGLEQALRLLRNVMFGRLNIAGEVVLLAGTTTTIIEDNNFTFTTEIVLIPRNNADAAALWWLAGRAKGSLTVGHDSGGADRTFGYLVVG